MSEATEADRDRADPHQPERDQVSLDAVEMNRTDQDRETIRAPEEQPTPVDAAAGGDGSDDEPVDAQPLTDEEDDDALEASRPATPLSRLILTMAGAVVVLAGMMTLQSVVAPALLALFMMILFRPISAWLENHGVPKPLVMLFNMVLIYGVLLGLAFCIYLGVAQFAVIATQQAATFNGLWNQFTAWLQSLGVQNTDISSLINLISPARIAAVAQQLLTTSASLLTLLSLLAAVVFFMSLDASNFAHRLSVAVRFRPAMSKALHDFGNTTRSYFAVAATFGAIVAVLDWLVLLWVGVPYAWLWALLAFVTNFVPNVGFIIGLIPPTLVALLVNDWQSAVLVFAGYMVINIVVQTMIQPAVVGDRVQLNTTISFLSLIVWTFILGGLGAILAVPLTLMVRALFIDSRPELRWLRALLSSGGSPGSGRHGATKKVAQKNAPTPAPPEPAAESH